MDHLKFKPRNVRSSGIIRSVYW